MSWFKSILGNIGHGGRHHGSGHHGNSSHSRKPSYAITNNPNPQSNNYSQPDIQTCYKCQSVSLLTAKFCQACGTALAKANCAQCVVIK